jgi:signal transduction histidine kinase
MSQRSKPGEPETRAGGPEGAGGSGASVLSAAVTPGERAPSRPPESARGPESGLARPRDSQPSSGRLSTEIPGVPLMPGAPETHISGHAPSFLDKLFATFVALGVDATLEDAVSALIGAFAEVFDDVAIGACVAVEDAGQVTLRRSPRKSRHDLQDPTRLFPEFDHEWRIDLGGGSTLHVATDDESTIATVRDPAERLAMALRSVLERTRMVAQLRSHSRESEELRLQIIHSEKLASLGQIAAGIVHELNNPLTSILAYSDYLRRDWEKRGVSQADTERLRRIGEAAERILTFTRDLIAYSRPSASVPGPVQIHDVLDRALVFCEHVITTSKVVVERRFSDDVPLVSGVPGQLTQVFVNLFTNACQAMKEDGGTLLVSTELSDDETRVIVCVSDEGHGIRDEHMPKLFEPYFTTKLDGGGTGLGLPIVRNIVQSHGGSICAKNHDRGASFVVELPVSARISVVDGG